MVETLCHSAMTSVPPVVAAGSGLYFVPARSMPFEGTGVGLPGAAAEPAAGADAAASLEDGPTVCPHALATRATTPKRATRRFCDICIPFTRSGVTSFSATSGAIRGHALAHASDRVEPAPSHLKSRAPKR